jgi:hypothetical protein
LEQTTDNDLVFRHFIHSDAEPTNPHADTSPPDAAPSRDGAETAIKRRVSDQLLIAPYSGTSPALIMQAATTIQDSQNSNCPACAEDTLQEASGMLNDHLP